MVLKDLKRGKYGKGAKDMIFIIDIRSLMELVFQEIAEHKSDSFHDFEVGRNSKKLLSACCHTCTVQVTIRILQVPLKSPAQAPKAN